MVAKIDLQTHVMSWMGRDIPMKSTKNLLTSPSDQIEDLHNYFLQEESEDCDIISELYIDDIVTNDQKYQAVTPDQVVQQLPHLIKNRKRNSRES